MTCFKMYSATEQTDDCDSVLLSARLKGKYSHNKAELRQVIDGEQDLAMLS